MAHNNRYKAIRKKIRKNCTKEKNVGILNWNITNKNCILKLVLILVS